MTDNLYDVIVVGAGAAGLTAGIYTSRAKHKTLILNEGAVGGQMVLTNEIANYPGVPTTNGYMLANAMRTQARQFGSKIKNNVKITSLQLEGDIKEVGLHNGEVFYAKTVILTPGGKPRSLNIPGEDKFKGMGISYCATCDGEFFQDKEVVVVGGGNSALEEAITLTSFASKVTIVHQFDHFQAFEHAIEEVKNNPKIEIVLSSELREFKGEEKLQSVVVEHLPTGKQSEIKVDGVFIFIGYIPNTAWLNGAVQKNDNQEIITTPLMETNVGGVFAGGDCIAKKYRQVTTAVADGTIAALSASEYLRNHHVS